LQYAREERQRAIQLPFFGIHHLLGHLTSPSDHIAISRDQPADSTENQLHYTLGLSVMGEQSIKSSLEIA
jgi:hypothetical protein